MNKLILIGIQDENLSVLQKQLTYIYNQRISVQAISLKEIHNYDALNDNIVLLPGESIKDIVQPFLTDSSKCIISKRVPNILNIKELMYIKETTSYLVINDSEVDTLELKNAMQQLLPQHQYYPYYGVGEIPNNIHQAITPGEIHLVPNEIDHIINIGTRVISIKTIQEINDAFNMQIDQEELMQSYLKSLIYLADNVDLNEPRLVHNENKGRLFSFLQTQSNLFKQTISIAKQLSQSNATIHIEGESGTGKQMFAEMIHNESLMKKGSFFVYNCLDKDMESIDQDLFGNNGLFHNNFPVGTLFIKNIDHLPYSLQGTLLQIIENNNKSLRFITSASTSLNLLLKQEMLRTELYAYLSPYTLQIPNLCDRKEDIELLIEDFKNKLRRNDLVFSTDVLETFHNYDWPGNIRELFNVISYCACLNTSEVELHSLPIYFAGRKDNKNKKNDFEDIIHKIEKHGFINESITLLRILYEGKVNNESFGRSRLRVLMKEKGCSLTDQQLRLRLETLNELNLLNVRIGRAGTTISMEGESFLKQFEQR